MQKHLGLIQHVLLVGLILFGGAIAFVLIVPAPGKGIILYARHAQA